MYPHRLHLCNRCPLLLVIKEERSLCKIEIFPLKTEHRNKKGKNKVVSDIPSASRVVGYHAHAIHTRARHRSRFRTQRGRRSGFI